MIWLSALWRAISRDPVLRFIWWHWVKPVLWFFGRYGGVILVASLFILSFPLSSLYHLADDLEAARRIHLFAKYVLIATGLGLAVWICPPQRLVVRTILALFFVSESWDGMNYAVCRLVKKDETTAFLADAWGTGVPQSLCARAFQSEYPRVIQITVLFSLLGWILWRYMKARHPT